MQLHPCLLHYTAVSANVVIAEDVYNVLCMAFSRLRRTCTCMHHPVMRVHNDIMHREYIVLVLFEAAILCYTIHFYTLVKVTFANHPRALCGPSPGPSIAVLVCMPAIFLLQCPFYYQQSG